LWVVLVPTLAAAALLMCLLVRRQEHPNIQIVRDWQEAEQALLQMAAVTTR
jgi:hypothetical protein